VSIIETILEIEGAFGIEFDNSKLTYTLLRSIRSISQHVDSIINERALS
jgi:acyl carrier protein